MRKPTKGIAEYILRLYDGFDNQWMDIATGSYDTVKIAFLKHTANGTKNKQYSDVDYYDIFPADTTMLYSGGFGEH